MTVHRKYGDTVLRADDKPAANPVAEQQSRLARKIATAGWIAQWKEMIREPHQRIGRPRQLYTCSQEKPFVPLGERG